MLHLKCVMNWWMTFKPGFHMMATIVTIAVIGEKISSLQRCVMNWWMTFKPGFHMMATINYCYDSCDRWKSKFIAAIKWKPLSSDRSVCSDHGDNDLWDRKSYIVFAAIAGDCVSIIWSLWSLSFFLSDCQDHSDCRDCSVYMETRLYFNTKLRNFLLSRLNENGRSL